MCSSCHLWCTTATIDLNLFRVFAMVYEAGSFSGAAKRMNVPRSTVSRAVAALEDVVGEPLFHRTTRSMQVTAAGIALYDRIASSLGQLSGALEDLPARHEEPTGTVTVTTTVDVGIAILAEAATRFIARWPKVKVDVLLTPRVYDFAREGIDLALRIATSKLPDSALVARKVGTVDFHLFASPSYIARRGQPRSPADFPSFDWVGFRGPMSPSIAGALEDTGIGSLARILCDDMFFLRETVRRGDGIAAMPSFVAEEDRKAGTLVRVLPRWTFSSGEVFLVHRDAKKLPARVVAFRDIVSEVLRQSPL
jgi:DNA-binding transcriptional LysR family regulator